MPSSFWTLQRHPFLKRGTPTPIEDPFVFGVTFVSLFVWVIFAKLMVYTVLLAKQSQAVLHLQITFVKGKVGSCEDFVLTMVKITNHTSKTLSSW